MTSLPSMKIVKTGARITVHPVHSEFYTSKDIIDECEQIVRDIKRHVDRVASVEVTYDTALGCEHCGYELHGSPDPELGYECCDAHIEEWKAAHKVTK